MIRVVLLISPRALDPSPVGEAEASALGASSKIYKIIPFFLSALSCIEYINSSEIKSVIPIMIRFLLRLNFILIIIKK